MGEFNEVQRPTGKVWLHNSSPIWIVPYDAVPGMHAAHYRVYRSVEKIPRGREPWAVDNRAIGERNGYSSLDAAMAAASEKAGAAP